MKKSIMKLVLISGIIFASIGFVSAVTKSKNLSVNSSFGTALETVTLEVTLTTVKSPKLKASTTSYTANTGYRWSGFSNKVTTSISSSGNSATYKVTGEARWTDYNYVSHLGYGYQTFTYEGTLN